VNEAPPQANESTGDNGPLSTPKKRATIVDQEDGAFGVEYDNTINTRNVMRLDAETYEEAIIEAKAYLEIEGDQDADGNLWEID
jgi:hypothetical protein